MTEAFVYCWTDHATGKLYVGSHKGFIDDGYICSSRLMLHEFKLRSSDFERSIIATGTWKDMLSLEYKILKSINAKDDPLFYNATNGKPEFHLASQTPEHRAKIAAGHIGIKRTDNIERNKKRVWTEESKEKLRQARLRQGNPMTGRKHSEASKEKMRLARMSKR